MDIYTIGFTKKSAEDFFETLRQNSIEQLVDVRLNNTSQLAGFAKRRDLIFFLRELIGADYFHRPILAPTDAWRGSTPTVLMSVRCLKVVNWDAICCAVAAGISRWERWWTLAIPVTVRVIPK